ARADSKILAGRHAHHGQAGERKLDATAAFQRSAAQSRGPSGAVVSTGDETRREERPVSARVREPHAPGGGVGGNGEGRDAARVAENRPARGGARRLLEGVESVVPDGLQLEKTSADGASRNGQPRGRPRFCAPLRRLSGPVDGGGKDGAA